MNDANEYFRIFDANLNRSREGIRVVEDTARFILKNEKAYKILRGLRHRLDKITRKIYPELLLKRDSAGDTGRKIKEPKRKNLYAVLAANFRRAEESLRVLEEYSKLVMPGSGPKFKEIRFKLYISEKKLSRQGGMARS
jgi:thiamine-phosphate pyrophosphorylase